METLGPSPACGVIAAHRNPFPLLDASYLRRIKEEEAGLGREEVLGA